MPDGLPYRDALTWLVELQKLAEQDGISIEQFVALAVAEEISALTTEGYLQERAKRGATGDRGLFWQKFLTSSQNRMNSGRQHDHSGLAG